MASIDIIGSDGRRLPAGSKAPKGAYYRVRYRTPEGKSRTKTFPRRFDAEQFAATVEHSKSAGEFVDPKLGRLTVAEWWERWHPTQVQWTPATRNRYRGDFANYIKPKIGSLQLGQVRPSDLQAVLASAMTEGGRPFPKGHERAGERQGLAVGTCKVLRSLIASMFTAAVADGLLVKSPGAGLKLPKDDPAEPRPLDDDEIDAMLAACDEWERAWVLLGLGTGVRISEGLAVRLSTLDFLRRSLRVGDQALQLDTGHPVELAPLKNRKPREVPLSDTLVRVLARHVELYGSGAEGVLFPNPHDRQLWRRTNAGERFGAIVRRAQLPDGLTWHCLRDTAATKMLTAGMNPAAVAAIIGNTVPVLLTRYAGVLRSDTEIARSALEALVERAGVQPNRAEHGAV